MDTLQISKFEKGDGLNSDFIYLDKCVVCRKPAPKCCSRCEMRFYCGQEHQRLDWPNHKLNCCSYEIKIHETLGAYMVASRSIEPGTTIAVEYPLAIYNDLTKDDTNLQQILSISRVTSYSCPSCQEGKLTSQQIYQCSKCGIPLCKKDCETNGLHTEMECNALQELTLNNVKPYSMKDALDDLALFRVLLKERTKPRPISFQSPKWQSLMRKVFSEKLNGGNKDTRLKSLSEEIMTSLRTVELRPLSLQFSGHKELITLLNCAITYYSQTTPEDKKRKFLYTKSHWLTHSCVPNAQMWIDGCDNYYKLVIKAIRPIKAGHRITIDKAENFSSLPTIERRKKLQELYNINCKCKRCRDPTELGGFISSIRCDESIKLNHCYGHYISTNPLDDKALWKCTESSCKSTKSYSEIQQLVTCTLKELPAHTGQAEPALKKLKIFIDFYNGDVLSPSHYAIYMAKARMRQIVKFFLGTHEKMFLCLVNEYPRSYEYCKMNLKALEAMLSYSKIFQPTFNKRRGMLLCEKGWTELAMALYEYQVLHVHTGPTLVRKIQEVWKMFGDAEYSVSIYSHAHVRNIQESINFVRSVIKRVFTGCVDFELETKNPSSNYYAKIPSSACYESVETNLPQFHSAWKNKSKEIGLINAYLEPSTMEFNPSTEKLRNIINTNI